MTLSILYNVSFGYKIVMRSIISNHGMACTRKYTYITYNYFIHIQETTEFDVYDLRCKIFFMNMK